MARSKIDRIQEVYTRRLYDAIDAVVLDLYRNGKSASAEAVFSVRERLRHGIQRCGTYERLELSDIIKGHKRAWPDVEAP